KNSTACSLASVLPPVCARYHHKPAQNNKAAATHTSDHAAASFTVTRCARPPLNSSRSTTTSTNTTAANTPHNQPLPTEYMRYSVSVCVLPLQATHMPANAFCKTNKIAMLYCS